MRDWLTDHWLLLTLSSAAMAVGGLLVAVFVAVRLPADYFVRRPERAHDAGLVRKIAKNAVGVVFLLLGVVMSLPLVPGPGLVLIVLGLSLTDFPGKRNLEVKLLRFPGLLSQLNQIRAKYNRPPLELPGKAPKRQSGRPGNDAANDPSSAA